MRAQDIVRTVIVCRWGVRLAQAFLSIGKTRSDMGAAGRVEILREQSPTEVNINGTVETGRSCFGE